MLSPDSRRVSSLNSCPNDNVSISPSGSEEIGSKDSSLLDSSETSKDPCLDSDRDLLNEPFPLEGLEEEVLKPKLLLIELLDELPPDCNPMGLCDDPRREPDNGVEALDWD